MEATADLFLASVPTWLIVLKFLGLGLAAGSSIWATLNDLTVATPSGRKQLTTPGVVSIVLTIFGLVISIVSEDLQRRQAARSQAAQVVAEAKRTNDIIIAGQPLRSLTLTLAFRGLDLDLVQLLARGKHDATSFIDEQQGEQDRQQTSAVHRERQLYPFLATLARRFAKEGPAKNGDANVVVLVAMGDDQNAILPFGFLDEAKPWIEESRRTTEIVRNPLSLEIGSRGDLGNSDLLSWPVLDVRKENVTITWRLDPSTFARSVQRQNEFVVPTANLPKLVPNNSALVSYTYGLAQVYETLFRDSYGEANEGLRCLVFEFHMFAADR